MNVGWIKRASEVFVKMINCDWRCGITSVVRPVNQIEKLTLLFIAVAEIAVIIMKKTA